MPSSAMVSWASGAVAHCTNSHAASCCSENGETVRPQDRIVGVEPSGPPGMFATPTSSATTEFSGSTVLGNRLEDSSSMATSPEAKSCVDSLNE